MHWRFYVSVKVKCYCYVYVCVCVCARVCVLQLNETMEEIMQMSDF